MVASVGRTPLSYHKKQCYYYYLILLWKFKIMVGC